MSIRLKSRHQCPPGGFQFKQPQTGWEKQAWDFRSLCLDLQRHRQANPKFNLPTDLADIMDEVDEANATRVLAIRGADIYVTSTEGPPPKLSAPRPPVAGVGAKIKSGLELLKEMLEGEPVNPSLSSARASVCGTCPQNGQGDWTSYFTIPAAGQIRLMLEARTGLKLATPLDDKLGICEACSCPLKLKVHLSPEVVARHTAQEVMDKVPDVCWMKTERQ